MPNHFHVLCKAKPLGPDILIQIKLENTKKAIAFLAEQIPINTFYESQFKRLFNGYTNAINKQEANRHGSLFKAKFKRTFVANAERFLYFIQYIHHNPIHHGFTNEYDFWQYSSYATYLSQTDEMNILSMSPVLKLFGTMDDFVKSHHDFKDNFEF